MTPVELPVNDHRRQLLYPVVDQQQQLVGVITKEELHKLVQNGKSTGHSMAELAQKEPVVAYADEPLRVVVNRMAETGLTRFPVVEREDSRKLAGMVSLSDLLRARTRSLEEERHRERVLKLRLPFSFRRTPVSKE
jgi:CBS-domain-containing membrane protein